MLMRRRELPEPLFGMAHRRVGRASNTASRVISLLPTTAARRHGQMEAACWRHASAIWCRSTLPSVTISPRRSGSRLALSDLPTLERLRRRLDLILFASALVLGIGLIDMKYWQAWPLPFVENGKDYERFTNAFIAFQSVCYVGVLATIYLPTALVLDAARARIKLNAGAGLADGRVAPPSANDDLAASQASSLSAAVAPVAVLLRTVTVLSPVLVGPLATIVQLKLFA